MTSSLLDVCRFNPTTGGTTDWTYSSAVTGYQSPAAASVVNGATYSYRAESNDLSQWEIGTGVYNTSTGVLARGTVLFNSAGTTAKISFSTTPQVAIVALAEDLQKKLAAGQLPGTATNDNATAGNVGEYVSSQVLLGSGVPLTAATAADITSISLSAGDWDVSGNVYVSQTSGTTQIEGWIGTVAHTDPTRPNVGGQFQWAGSTTLTVGHAISPTRLLLSTTTTVYLGVVSNFSGTAVAYGFIGARRMR